MRASVAKISRGERLMVCLLNWCRSERTPMGDLYTKVPIFVCVLSLRTNPGIGVTANSHFDVLGGGNGGGGIGGMGGDKSFLRL